MGSGTDTRACHIPVAVPGAQTAAPAAAVHDPCAVQAIEKLPGSKPAGPVTVPVPVKASESLQTPLLQVSPVRVMTPEIPVTVNTKLLYV